MNKKIIKTSKALIKSIDTKNFIVDALVSTDAVDRDGEVIMKTAWTNGLKDYLAHPVLLSSHNYFDLTSQIGKALATQVTDEGLICKFQYFVGEGNEEADWAFKLASKEIAAYSVGFIGKDWIEGDYSKGIGRMFTEVSLLEVSQVLIPCNPEALQRQYEDPLQKELVALASKAFKWEQKNPKGLKVTKSKIKSIAKDCVTVEVTVEDDAGNSYDQTIPIPIDDSVPMPQGPGLPTLPDYLSQDNLNQMMLDTNRICLKEHHEEIKKLMHDIFSQYMGKGSKHYSEILFKDQPNPSGSPESTKEAKEALIKTIEEAFKK